MKKFIIIIGTVVCISLIGLSITYYIKNNNKNLESNKKTQKIEFVRDEIEDIKIIKIAHSFPEYHPQHMALVQKFSQIVGKESDWKIIVEIYPNNKLGEESQYVKGVQQGTIEMCIGRESLDEYIPTLRVINFPYLFESYDEMTTVLNSNVINQTSEQIEKLGIHTLAWSFNGVKQISTFEKDITSLEEGALQIATTALNKENIEVLGEIGFNVCPTNSSSLTGILKQKKVDGHASSLLESYYNGWYDNQNKLYIFNYSFEPTLYMMSSEFWQLLTDEEKAIIKKAAKESSEYEIELLTNMEEEIYNNLKKQGMDIELMDLKAYKEKIQPLYNIWINKEEGLQKAYNKLISAKKDYIK